MTIIQTLILSVIEGITEFLPISSTGHMILTSYFLNIPQTEFLKSFEVIIQFGAILAVVFLYFKKIILNRQLWLQLIVAFIPTGILGFILYPFIKSFLLSSSLITVISLIVGGIVLLFIDRLPDHQSSSTTKLSYPRLASIGLFQSISMIPGVSRAAATIIGGQICGLTRAAAVEFSFLLAIPTMAAATGLDLLETQLQFSPHEIQMLVIGFFVSFVTAIIAVKTFLAYVSKHSFKIFGVYRILLGLLYLFFVGRF